MNNIVKPTPEQLEWADCEVGVIIHFDPVTFVNDYEYFTRTGGPIPASSFAPDALDTDQWIRTAKDMGANYAILVAKHCTGFSLWPTAQHDYSVKSSPYKSGNGDIVGEFFNSCAKYGVRPGLYYSTSFNEYMNVSNPGTVRDGDPTKQRAYNEIVLAQLTELWTRYGKVFEIWFDGGCMPVEQGGPDVAGLLNQLQPDAVVYQGPRSCKSLVRWIGNERGTASENCSSTFSFKHMNFDGTEEHLDDGNPLGDTWCPPESDFPNRHARQASYGGWFWGENQADAVVSADEMFNIYLESVGRNTNMLVGMAIDRHGLFDVPDTAAFEQFGRMRRAAFTDALAEADVTCGGNEYSLELPAGRSAKYIVLGERIAEGERVLDYTITGADAAGSEVYSYAGKVVGHKRILPVPETARTFKLVINNSKAEPIMRWFKAY